jgi:ferredoxin
MNINSVNVIYFSPTQTTKTVLEAIARGIGVDIVRHIDLTPPRARSQEFEEIHDELAIIGAPVYGGRIPKEAERRLRRIHAQNTPAVIIAVYGNRAYEHTLAELKSIALEAGFMPFAGAAFIGASTANYALADDMAKIAAGRPDREDVEKASAFGREIRKIVTASHAAPALSPIQVPGNVPAGPRKQPPQTSPDTQDAQCTRCASCAAVCPMAAIMVSEKVVTDQTACIMCCACVKQCPTGARGCEHTWMKQAGEWLSVHCQTRREPEIS